MSEEGSSGILGGLDLSPHWSLDFSVTFLNHGSFGAVPRRIQDVQGKLRAQMEAEPVRFFTRELPVLLSRVRGEFAEFLGAEPEGLAFVSNTTEGVNAVLRSLEWSQGDEILVTDQGYGACTNACEFVARRAGATVVTVRLPRGEELSPESVVEAILAGVSERTKLALVDHVTSSTGLVLPIQEIVEALRERGVETLVDGAHGPGQVELDVEDIGAAYYVGNAHKWLCAPRGAAFLAVRADLREGVRPLGISHGATMETSKRSRFLQEFDWTGTRDPTAWLAIPETIRFVSSLYPGGWEGVRRRNSELAKQARRRLLEIPGVEAAGPEEMVGSMAAVVLPRGEGKLPSSVMEVDPLQVELFEEEGIEVPIFVLREPAQRILRVSVHLYNRPEEIELVADAVATRHPGGRIA